MRGEGTVCRGEPCRSAEHANDLLYRGLRVGYASFGGLIAHREPTMARSQRPFAGSPMRITSGLSRDADLTIAKTTTPHFAAAAPIRVWRVR